MKPPREIGIGLMGLGVVGGGVALALLHPSQPVPRRVGCPIILKKVLVRDGLKPRSIPVPQDLLTTDPREILANPEVQVLVEVIGGRAPRANISGMPSPTVSMW